jgi:hypothetical protein
VPTTRPAASNATNPTSSTMAGVLAPRILSTSLG